MTLFSLVAISDRSGRLLMQERDDEGVHEPSRWCLPGGAREGNESPHENAVRELAEETGLTGIDLTEIAISRHFSPLSATWVEFATYGAITDLTDADVQCHEGKQMVFREISEIWDLDLTRSTARVLPEVLATTPYRDAHGHVSVPERRRFSGVILVDQRGWILMQERDEHPLIDPECWGLSGGHVDDGETMESAAYRELQEETGVVAAPGSLELFGEFIVDHRESYGSWDSMAVYAASTRLVDADIDCREGRQIVFVEPAVARTLRLTRGGADIIPAFLGSDLYARLKEQS